MEQPSLQIKRVEALRLLRSAKGLAAISRVAAQVARMA